VEDDWRPQVGDLVWSSRLTNRVGTIRDHQGREGGDPERWLVSPCDRHDIARWLTRGEFTRAREG